MLHIVAHKQRQSDEFCQLRIAELDGTRLCNAGWLTLTLDEARIIAMMLLIAGKVTNINVTYKETCYEAREEAPSRDCMD